MEELLFGSIRMKIPDAQFRVSTDSMVLADFCRIKHGSRVLDLGCGSGILSIAALLFGAERVTMCDIFENAVKTASENVEKNKFTHEHYSAFCGNIIEDEALRQIAEKGYARPYATDPRKLFRIGVNFSSETGTISKFEVSEG